MVLEKSIVISDILRTTSDRRAPERMDLETGLSTVSSQRKLPWTYIINIPIIVAFITLICLFETKQIPVNKGGFFCNDPKLSHKFTGETVSPNTVLLTSYLLPMAMVIIAELVMNTRHEDTVKAKLKRAFINTGNIYKYFLYGVMMTMTVCEVAKGLLGMPRPVFFDLCKPDSGLTCKGSEYVSEYTCTSEYNWWRQEDASRSFPSGHSAIALYSGFFMVWYLQRRAVKSSNASTLAVPALQILCVCYTAVCSLTRVTDNMHHWWDVLFGLVIGIFTVFYTCNVLMNNFKMKVVLPKTSKENVVVN